MGAGCEPGDFKPRLDSVRNAVERRMANLGMQTGRERKAPASATAKPWTPAHVTALLGAPGGDLIDKSLEEPTEHSIRCILGGKLPSQNPFFCRGGFLAGLFALAGRTSSRWSGRSQRLRSCRFSSGVLSIDSTLLVRVDGGVRPAGSARTSWR
jgi:hypothetical protein